MLIEVVGEQPAAQADNLEQEETLSVVENLVKHYAQTIHIPSPPCVPYFAEAIRRLGENDDSEATIRNVPSVTEYCLEQVLRSSRQETEHVNTQTKGGVVEEHPRRRNDDSIRKLLCLYPTKIRPTLFDGKDKLYPTGVAVLYHYEWLLTLLEQDEQSSPSRDTGRGGVVTTTSLTPLDPTSNHGDPQETRNLLETIMQALCLDLTKCVPIAIREAMSESPDENKSPTINLHYLTQQYVIPTILRLLHKCLVYTQTIQINRNTNETMRRVAVRLLAWNPPDLLLGPLQVAPTLQTELLSPIMGDNAASSFQTYYLPAKIRGVKPQSFPALNWNQALEIKSKEWNSQVASRCAASIWKAWSGESSNDLVRGQKLCMERCDWNAMANALRQHFFGKEEDPEDALPMVGRATTTRRTRLHLGRTVPDEPVEYEKPFRAIPSRLHAACVFISLLDHVNDTMLQDLVPILYELLAAPQETIQAMGAACLYHLLDISKDQAFLWTPLLLSNFVAALDLAVQTCRKGPAVTVLGIVQCTVLRRLSQVDDDEASQRRGKASQQWLMILHKNLHNSELVWGVLAGAAIQLGLDHVGEDIGGALELGRLALSCLLPLIRRDDGTSSGAETVMGIEIQWFALVALAHWLVAAHPVMVRHEGKLLGSLLLCLGRNPDEASATFIWAKHVAAMVVVAVSCGNHDEAADQSHICSAKMKQIVDSGFYDERLVTIVRQILQDAQVLNDKLA